MRLHLGRGCNVNTYKLLNCTRLWFGQSSTATAWSLSSERCAHLGHELSNVVNRTSPDNSEMTWMPTSVESKRCIKKWFHLFRYSAYCSSRDVVQSLPVVVVVCYWSNPISIPCSSSSSTPGIFLPASAPPHPLLCKFDNRVHIGLQWTEWVAVAYLARLLQTSGDATVLYRQLANELLAARPANRFVLAN